MHERRTAGSKCLRAVIQKLNRVDANLRRDSWGDVYDGTQDRPLDAEEHRLRDSILTGSLRSSRAERILSALDPQVPFGSRVELVEALAAISVLYPEDMDLIATGKNKSVRKILWTAALASRLEWYMNNQRARHSLTACGPLHSM